MKKKFIYAFLGVITLSLSLTSCKKYLDINKNPNSAEAVDPKLLFAYAATTYVDLRASGDYWIPFALAGQTVSDGGNNPTGWGIPDAGEYVISTFSTGNSWRSLYTTMGGNLRQAISLAESASPKNNNAAAQCKVLLALAFYDATTMYGDVPYTEAINPLISYPHFDSQQTVLEGVVATLNDAIAQFDTSSPLKIGGIAAIDDPFYGGDIAKWKRLATSLKLRTLMVLVDKDPTKATQIGAMLTAGGLISSAADNFKIPFQNVTQKNNPKYAINLQYNGGISFFFASKYITDVLDPVNDPRLPKLFDKPAGATHYVGITQGDDGDDTLNPRISASLHTATEPETIYDYQDELFYEAEIYARGLGVPVNLVTAAALYKQAVAESCKFYGVDATTANTFSTTGLPAFTVTPVANIHYQHWIDLMDRPLEAFTEWRRSGPEGSEVPNLQIPTGAPANGLFRRYEYPITNEISVNPFAPKTVIKYYTKQWFDL
ncbi:SusD/RagB family nutrient-binding outer membrane lipoprotein [Mucilaginibacter sp. HMF5004]|uniref:SusD/RagB family nutrient-binding outer membrane lipoprotein n=1 Tax=Mucilaginibacter rivuli TaxID=2857527 RepID=UPI001C5CDF93|nr:SusD/RagB family nutrient-binding outer membrane lipoprotein [Mucilaginibacter rivuli]MBW4890040.1 SusD/RagB family nutrient-binding outer membrane lipoprotein [Mucilaginibacter rivuli]